MNANDKQVGGDHYQAPYQHWDWVIETNQGYLMGCATKYITRHRKKNGQQDLEKALHYLHKLLEQIEQLELVPRVVPECARLTDYFILQNNMDPQDAAVLRDIIDGDIPRAIGAINAMIPKH